MKENMKRLVLVFLVTVSLGAYARNVSDSGSMKSEAGMNNAILVVPATPDGFILKDGKMMMVNNGKWSPMVRDITLPNGTVVMSTGYYMKKDGPKTELKEGEHIDMDGNLTKMDESTIPKTSPDKSMNDTTTNR